jgi:uncharacterized protein YdhG (YjbR/CyaY superfamily)
MTPGKARGRGKAGLAPRQRIKAGSIDEYLAALGRDQREALERVRRTIRAAAPAAEERISYGLPAFRLEGRMLVAFGAAARHGPFHPMSGVTIARHQAALEGFETSKGTVHFPPDRPLPASLVKRLVRARIAENRRAAAT